MIILQCTMETNSHKHSRLIKPPKNDNFKASLPVLPPLSRMDKKWYLNELNDVSTDVVLIAIIGIHQPINSQHNII